jgi:serine/threonine-protein kinase HipA
MGGLRFTYGEDQPFLAEKTVYSVPPLHALRELEQASQSFEQASPDDPEYEKWLRLLLAPGTSLGGARPKGTVIDTEASLWIAKFPSRSDEYDVGAWESLVYELASKAGIDTVHSRAEKFSEQGHTFLIKRFDREGAQRIHFASAMTLLGHHDGDGEAIGVSYLDLVDLIEHISENPNRDLEELWRRVVFNILVRNTDDHLRNHGFLLGAKGWKLSPVYDVNPQPWQGGLAINIDENHNECSLELAFSVAEYFRLSKKRAEQVVKDVEMAVKEWENKARVRGLNRDEIERMRAAFQ